MQTELEENIKSIFKLKKQFTFNLIKKNNINKILNLMSVFINIHTSRHRYFSNTEWVEAKAPKKKKNVFL